MKADYLSYRRATNVSILGMVLQGLLAGLMFAYAFLNRDHAAMTATIYISIGLLAWLTLAILFDQHRRERIEAFEAESLGEASSASESVFAESAEETRVAARRLQGMYKFFAPIMSLVLGGLMVGVGIARFSSGQQLLSPDSYQSPDDHGFALLVSLAAAASFVFARFVSGMGKQRVWQNLGAGASTVVGAAVFGLLLAIGQFLDIAGSDAFLRYLQVVLPVIMIAQGAEIFLNFLLEIYRPRSKGELPRVAFESRVMGFLAAPDRVAASIGEAINYQFGSDVSSSWAYKLLSRWSGVLLMVALVVGWLMTSFAVVQPHQRGVMLRFGRIIDGDVGPGFHFKAPWPIDRIVSPEFIETDQRGRVIGRTRTATGVRVLQLGTAPPSRPGPILWTNEHAAEEFFSIVHAGAAARSAGELTAGSGEAENDLSLVAVEVPVHFVVRDVEAFERLGMPEDREDMLRTIGQRTVMQFLSNRSSDDLLGSNREKLAAELQDRVQQAFDAMNPGPEGALGAGVEVLFVGVVNPHPPRKAARSFEQVVGAQQNAESTLEAAREDRIEVLTAAIGDVELATTVIDRLDAIQALRDERQRAPEGPGRVELATRIADASAELEALLVSGAGEASSTLSRARATRWERHMAARGRADRYEGQLVAFEAQPLIYKSIRYFDALSDLMKGSRLYVLSSGVNKRLTVNLEDVETAQNVFNQGGEGQ
ncbi:MAG: SPFH domain-containing protein [Phycisphaerales bacterium JB037]